MESNLYLDKRYRKVRFWQRAIFLGTVATVLFAVLAFTIRLSTDIYSAPAFLAAAMFPAVVFICFSVCKMYSWEKRAQRQEEFLVVKLKPISGEHAETANSSESSIKILKPGTGLRRSSSAKMVYVKELDALVREDLLPDFLSQREASPETDTPGADCRPEDVSGRSGGAGGLHVKNIVWKWDKDVFVPYCPHCDDLVYEKDHCVFCNQPYEWVDPKPPCPLSAPYGIAEVNSGEYKLRVSYPDFKRISLYKNNCPLRLLSCDKKMRKAELLQLLTDNFEWLDEYYQKLHPED